MKPRCVSFAYYTKTNSAACVVIVFAVLGHQSSEMDENRGVVENVGVSQLNSQPLCMILKTVDSL